MIGSRESLLLDQESYIDNLIYLINLSYLRKTNDINENNLGLKPPWMVKSFDLELSNFDLHRYGLDNIEVFAYHNPRTNQLLIVIPGTIKFNDLIKDFFLFTKGEISNDLVKNIGDLVLQKKNQLNAEVILTGHSLGGAIASKVAYTYHFKADVFESPGISLSPIEYTESINNFVTGPNPICCALNHPGNIIQVIPNRLFSFIYSRMIREKIDIPCLLSLHKIACFYKNGEEMKKYFLSTGMMTAEERVLFNRENNMEFVVITALKWKSYKDRLSPLVARLGENTLGVIVQMMGLDPLISFITGAGSSLTNVSTLSSLTRFADTISIGSQLLDVWKECLKDTLRPHFSNQSLELRSAQLEAPILRRSISPIQNVSRQILEGVRSFFSS